MSQTTSAPAYADVVDLERYPIHDLASERGQRLVADCKAELAATGVCHLDGFISPDAVAQMVQIAGDLEHRA